MIALIVDKRVCAIFVVSLFLLTSSGMARGEGIVLSLHCDKKVVSTQENITFSIIMTNETETPFLVVWNYPDSKNLSSFISGPSSPLINNGGSSKSQILKIPDTPPQRPRIINLISTFHIFLDNVLLEKSSTWTFDKNEQIRNGAMYNVLCLFPNMYISQAIVLRKCVGANTKEKPCLCIGKHKIRVEYTLTSNEFAYCTDLLKMQGLFLEYPLVPKAAFFFGTIRSNEIEIVVK